MKTQSKTMIIITGLAALLAAGTLSAAAKRKLSASDDFKIDRVTVFTDRALVTRSGELSLAKGGNTFVLEGMAAAIDEESLRLSWQQDGIELGSIFTFTELKKISNNRELQKIEEETVRLEADRSRQNEKINNIARVQSYVNSYRSLARQIISEGSWGFSETGGWEGALNLFSDSSRELTEKKIVHRKEIDRINRRLEELRLQKSSLDSPGNRHTRKLEFTLKAAKDMKTPLKLTYLVKNCGWNPAYRVEAKSQAGSVKMLYQANIRQNTGEDWGGVQLELSSAATNKGLNRPRLYALSTYAVLVKDTKMTVVQQQSKADPDLTADRPGPSKKDTSLLIKLAGLKKVPSDNRDHRFDLTEFTAPASRYFVSIPKRKELAYLQVESENKAAYPLLPGRLNIYGDSGFLGRSYMNYTSPHRKFTFYLGMDKDLHVERNGIPVKTSKSLMGGRKTFTRHYRFKVHNYKDKEVTLRLKDHIPVSLVEDFEVKVLDKTSGGYKLNKETGILYWELKLGANASKELELKFEVETPSDFSGSF